MTRHKITNAPSKYTLSVAFFDKLANERRSVTFRVNGPNTFGEQDIEVIINQLGWEDGSGESWLFEGYTKSRIANVPAGRYPKVKGWFATTDRKGWIDIDIKPSGPDINGLEWGPDLVNIPPLTFKEATAFVNDLNRSIADGSKWRLPTFKELDTFLYDENWRKGCRPSPAYWASNGYAPGEVWTVQVGGFDKNEMPIDSDFKGILRLVKVQ